MKKVIWISVIGIVLLTIVFSMKKCGKTEIIDVSGELPEWEAAWYYSLPFKM